MAEKAEGLESGAEASAAGVDPAAVALALGGASREKADAFLDEQRRLTAKQSHHLDEQLKRLKMGVVSDRLSITLKLLTALVGMGVAAAFAVMVWNAAHADGLIVESFSVPPDLAARGLTGQVVASQMLDKLTVLQNATVVGRPAKSYSNNWGDDLKVEIPDTGISVSEAYRFLRDWLGHETRITGEITRTASGIAVNARSGSDGGATFTGADSDLDQLLQKATEHVYGSTQPWRYGNYLSQHDRRAEAVAIFQAEAATGPAEERAWGYSGWYSNASADYATLTHLLEQGLALAPDHRTLLNQFRVQESYEGMLEEALRDEKKVMSVIATGDDHASTPEAYLASKIFNPANINQYTGAWHDMALATASIVQQFGSKYNTEQPAVLARAEVNEHDLAAARRTFVTITPATERTGADSSDAYKIRLLMWMAADMQDWAGVLTQENALTAIEKRSASAADRDVALAVPTLALARAKLGDIAGAEARIAPTPGYCNPCLIARAQIAEVAGQQARADWWFDQAVKDGPSIPFANAAWGQALLERKDYDGAIAKFTLANKKGPHFADPLEGWGEALMAKNRSDLALAKFTEANKYAPNWGRLHLKWGEALTYAGKPDEAKKQYAIAAGLDLTSAEKAELGRTH
jgi:tetratricopeptide (TPR) repeat protein